ncbi:MAG: lipid-A-disaccharide synthase [Cellvibrionales bacterium]|nr:lipid-A-disaccharide synthase [Cellvibrionales bacterium]
MKIAIVAGEASGDILGAGLIRELKQRYPQAEFFGVGGDRMIAEGFHSLFPLDRLSVMGFIEPLKRLPELFHIRKTLVQAAIDQAVDVFIGIDSPDFNLGIAKRLKKRGIKTCHYVSPSVWAWRQGRIKGIKASVDLMLTLLPFEAKFYQDHQVPVAFVGHPLADQIALEPNVLEAKQRLGLVNSQAYLAIMPGSREGEVARLGKLFLQVAEQLLDALPDMQFLIPAANPARMSQLQVLLRDTSEKVNAAVTLINGQSHDVMLASEAILLASGTTALEAMLLKKPMVVSYKLTPMTYAIVSRLVRCDYVSLPNLLADKPLVPELLQEEATIQNLSNALLPLLTDDKAKSAQVSEFNALHLQLKQDADLEAAKAIDENLLSR